MQKKLIALAVASALTVPALALADTSNVTVYGSANLSYDFVDSGANGIRSQRVSSNTSTLGLKGSEDVGGGLTAVWQVEQNIDMSGASKVDSAFGTQNTFAGLSSATMGTVVMGRHDTPYKIATRSLDQFASGIADNRSLMGSGFVAFDGRQPDVIAYISPALSGLTVAVGHVNVNQALGAAQNLAGDSKASAWSLAGLYGNGPLFASLAYETHNIGTGSINNFGLSGGAVTSELKEHATKLGLGYTAGAFGAGFAYEHIAGNLATDHNAYYLSGKFSVSASDAVKAAYTKRGDIGGVANTGANQFSLGYDHAMSKRTTVYALYTRLNNDSLAANGLSSVASADVTTNPAGLTVAGAGSDPSAVSIGMKHTF